MHSTYSTTTFMEKGGFYDVGNAAGGSDHGSEDAHSATSTFALDFAGMLDAADNLFHQQIYEYLQGPALQQVQVVDNHEFLSSSLDSQGAGFPAQSQYVDYNQPSGPPTPTPQLPALDLTSTFHTASIPGEQQQPLRSAGHVTSFLDTRSPPHLGLNLSRRDGSTTLESRRKEQAQIIEQLPGIESSAGMGDTAQWLPSGSSSAALSAQMTYSADVFHLPAQRQQPSLVPNGREFSSYETSCSPNGHVKRPRGGSEPDGLPISPRPRGRKAPKTEPARTNEEFVVKPHLRPVEQAEHIIRERLRRDDMSSKYLFLESLLPPGPKRDRSTVVEDSIQYVKTLHHRVNELHEKRLDGVKSNTISGYWTTLKCRRPNLVDRHDLVVKKKTLMNPDLITSPNQSNDLAMTSSSGSSAIEKIDVHLDLPHQIVIEMTCHPHRHIQSQIIVALERLGTDMSRCSISKLHNRLICVMAVKPREMTEPRLLTNDGVTGALMRAIVPYKL